MQPNYFAVRTATRKPLVFFGILFSFLLPPVGFLFDLIGLFLSLHKGIKIIGWIFLMIISVVMTIFLAILLFSKESFL